MNKCLLIVDVQKGFINVYTKHLPDKINKILKYYDKIFVTKFYNEVDSFYDTLLKWKHLRKNTEEFELAFKPNKKVEIVEKNIYSCVNNSFLKKLKILNIKRIDICGIDTDICVTKCAVDLFENGIIPVVLQEYCASTDGYEAHENAIKTLNRFIGVNQVL